MHLDFVALREPVTCTLPTDPPGHQRLVRQFRRLELEQFEQAQTLQRAGDVAGALPLFYRLAAWAVEATEAELAQLAIADLVRLLGAAQGKIELVEAALGNARSDGDSSSQTAPPSPAIPVSTTTTTARRSRPASRGGAGNSLTK
jgi:hypothetical protein